MKAELLAVLAAILFAGIGQFHVPVKDSRTGPGPNDKPIGIEGRWLKEFDVAKNYLANRKGMSDKQRDLDNYVVAMWHDPSWHPECDAFFFSPRLSKADQRRGFARDFGIAVILYVNRNTLHITAAEVEE